MGACTTLTRNGGGGGGRLLGAGNFQCIVITHECILRNTLYMYVQCVVIAHGRMHSLTISSTQSTGTKHVPFLSRFEHERLSGRLLRTTMNQCRKFGPQMWGGGGRVLRSGCLLGTLRYFQINALIPSPRPYVSSFFTTCRQPVQVC